MKLHNIIGVIREALAQIQRGGKPVGDINSALKSLEPVDLKWVGFLHEVGGPIRDEARDIERQYQRAAEEFERQMGAANERVGKLMAEVAHLWTPAEIGQAINLEREDNENPKI